jgi:uncharacterized protein (DUF885 family)
MRLTFRNITCAAALVASVHGFAAPSTHDGLTRLAEEITYTTADLYPMTGTELGLTAHDGDLDAPSEQSRSAYVALLKGWEERLDALGRSAGGTMSLVDRDDAKLLRASLDSSLNELLVRRTDRKNYAAAALNLTDAVFTQFLTLPIVGREGATQADVDKAWDNIVARLSKGPAYISAGQELATEPGRLFGTVGSLGLVGVPDFLGGALTDAAKSQLAGRPAVLRGFIAARDGVLAAVARTKAHIDAHVASWPENFAIGRRAYNQILREEELLPFSDAEIEVMARDELAHGWAEEGWLRSLASKRGIPFGPSSGGGLAPGGPALVGYYRDRIGELRRFVEEHDVVTMPSGLGAIEIVETPAFLKPVSPGASMYSPLLFSKSATGYYFITPPRSLADAAARLDMNEDFDRDRIWSTAAHEAMPGHFFQLSIARRHPDFVRRIQYSDVFQEGWAYYGEEMFVRLGLYGDDLDPRLFTARWERVRGARAIVDVKLACGEWGFQQAVDFFVGESGFTREASEAAVSSIALGPGNVISYTVGRLQLETLLGKYMERMGDRGSLHDFHDRLLSYGSVPFAVVGPELLGDIDKPASVVRAAANY